MASTGKENFPSVQTDLIIQKDRRQRGRLVASKSDTQPSLGWRKRACGDSICSR